jgi:arabinofuranan 3-O-arabinosyltransferase
MTANAEWITPARVRRVAVVLIAVGFAVLAGDAWKHLQHGGVTDLEGELLGRDFVNFWSGAKLAIHGRAADAYNAVTLHAFQKAHVDPAIGPRIFPYPPVAFFLGLPFAIFGYLAALFVWTLAGSSICAWMLSRLLGWRWGLLASLAPPAVLFNAWAGQNGAFTAALLAGGVILLQDQPVLSGLLFGAMCFKPQLAMLVPIALLGGNHWRAFISAGCTIAILVAATIVLFGPDCWHAFNRIAPTTLANLEMEPMNWKRMPSLYVMMRTLGAVSVVAYIIQGVAAAAAAVVVFGIWRSAASTLLKGSALILATFLVSPYTWDYDLVMITFALAFFWIASDGGLSGIEKYALAIGALLPLLSLLFATVTGFQIAPTMIAALLFMVYRRAVPSNV